MANKHLSGGRSPGEIAEHEISGTEGGKPRVPSAQMPKPRKSASRREKPRPPRPEPRPDDDPRGIAEIDIHSGRVLHEEHTKLPARPPGQPRFDPTGRPQE